MPGEKQIHSILASEMQSMLVGEKGALLRHAAESPENGVVPSRGTVERVLFLAGMLLPCFVALSMMLSMLPSTIAWYGGFCSSFSSSFFDSCGTGGFDC